MKVWAKTTLTTHARAEQALARARAAFPDQGRRLELLLYVSQMAELRGLPLRLYDVPSEEQLEQLLVWLDSFKGTSAPEYDLERFVVTSLGIVDRRHVIYDFSVEAVGSGSPITIHCVTDGPSLHVPVRLIVEDEVAPHFRILSARAGLHNLLRPHEFNLGPMRPRSALGYPADFFSPHETPLPLGLDSPLLRAHQDLSLTVRNHSEQPQRFAAYIVCVVLEVHPNLRSRPKLDEAETAAGFGAFTTDLDRF